MKKEKKTKKFCEVIINDELKKLSWGQMYHAVANFYRLYNTKELFQLLNRITKRSITKQDKIIIFNCLNQ